MWPPAQQGGSRVSGAGGKSLLDGFHLQPLLLNLQCWVTPRQFALSKAHEAFDPDGQLSTDAARSNVKAVVDQVLWAARQFQKA